MTNIYETDPRDENWQSVWSAVNPPMWTKNRQSLIH